MMLGTNVVPERSMSAADARPTAPGNLPIGMALPSTGDIKTRAAVDAAGSPGTCGTSTDARVRQAAAGGGGAASSSRRLSDRPWAPAAPASGSPARAGAGFALGVGAAVAGRRGRRGWRRRCRLRGGRRGTGGRWRRVCGGRRRGCWRCRCPAVRSRLCPKAVAPAVADSLNLQALHLAPPERLCVSPRN